MRPERTLAQRRAALGRRTTLIWWAKITLPIGAIVLVALIFLTGRERGDITDLFTPAEIATLGAGLKLERPRFAGALDSGEPYVVSADWALPDTAVPNIIALGRPVGRVTLSGERQIDARADAGELSRLAQTVRLTGAVTIDSSDGYHVETAELRIDMGAKTAMTPGPVRATGPRGSLEAGSFRMATPGADPKAAQIWFENRVRVVFIPANP